MGGRGDRGYRGKGEGGKGEEGSQILATRKPIKILTPPNPNILKILKTNNFHFLSRKPVVSYQRNSITFNFLNYNFYSFSKREDFL